MNTENSITDKKTWFIVLISQLSLLGLLLVIPVSSITAAREIFTFTTLAGVLLLLITRVRRIRLDYIWLLWLAVLLAALASLLHAVDVKYSLSMIRREILKGMLMFFIGLYVLSSRRAYEHTWRFMLLCLAIMSIYGVIAFLPHVSFSSGLRIIDYGRASSLTNGYGHFASYLAIMTPYLLVAPQALAFKSKSAWLAWAVILLFTLLAAYFTSTRILWASLLVAGVAYFWLMSKRRLLVACAGAALLAVLAAVVISLPQNNHGENWEQFLENPKQVQGTAGDLYLLWSFSYEKLSESPFTGVGFGKHSFIKAYPEFLQDKTNKALLHNHNIFVDAAVQMGIQGLIVMLLFFILIAKGLWAKEPPAKGDVWAGFRLATVLMLISFTLRNQVDEYFVDDSQLLFWLLVGMAWGTRYLMSEKGNLQSHDSTRE